MRSALALRHYSPRTVEAYLGWVRRFVMFHGRQHPARLEGAHVAKFLSNLAEEEQVSAGTQNQALAAILFMYRNVLGREMGEIQGVARARRPARLPVVMNRDEVGRVLAQLHGVWLLMASLLYGSGLRISECVGLRVKEVDIDAPS